MSPLLPIRTRGGTLHRHHTSPQVREEIILWAILVLNLKRIKSMQCSGLHPLAKARRQHTIYIMACSALTALEGLKVLVKEEGLSKICPPNSINKEYEALQLCMAPGEPGTHGHCLMVRLSSLSCAHMRMRDVLIFQSDTNHESHVLELL